MSHVSTTDLIEQLERENTNYIEVFSEDSLSVELAQYPNPESKTPHEADELYFVISGSGRVHVGDERYAVDFSQMAVQDERSGSQSPCCRR